ncbi:MAG: RHS repeat protein, partial [Planctomycetaceae bacterium]|nr:RHS repeat protein [Planctomycetaceae bacterium]
MMFLNLRLRQFGGSLLAFFASAAMCLAVMQTDPMDPYGDPGDPYGSTGGSYTDPSMGDTGSTDTGSSGTGTGDPVNPGGDPAYSGGTTESLAIIGSTAVQSSNPSTGGGEDECCVGMIMLMGGAFTADQGVNADVINDAYCQVFSTAIDSDMAGEISECSTCGGQSGAIPAAGGIRAWAPNAGGGCSTCGGAMPPAGGSAVGLGLNFEAGRAFRPDDRAIASSFGPGMFSNYDTRVYFYPDGTGGISAVLYDAVKGRYVHMNDGLEGDTADGHFSVVQETLTKELVLEDAFGNAVSGMSQATTARLVNWDGSQKTFDVVNLQPSGTPEYYGRLATVHDPNGHILTVSYRDQLSEAEGGFTAQELTDSPDRRLQIHQVVDWQGDSAVFHYAPTQVSGRWAVSSIETPADGTVNYEYANGVLSSVSANGVTRTFVYGQDETSQATTLTMVTSAGTERKILLTNDYMTMIQGGSSVIVNQPVGVVRMISNPSGEAEFILVPDQTQAGVAYVYGGSGVAAEITLGQSVRYYTDGWTVSDPNSLSLASGSLETTFASTANMTSLEMYTGAIPAVTDSTGRQYQYEYDSDSFLTKKTFVADATFEHYTYNAQKKMTRLRDRQGNVTSFEYDASGNLTKVSRGVREENGTDVPQAEYSEQRWEYYPAGHANAGLLKTEFEANWDGSSTDTHRTDYEYNARGNVTKRIGPASASGELRPETVWTYDTEDRVTSTTDPEGHTVTYSYDARGRVVTTTYDDGSTEQSLYGTPGTAQQDLVVKTKDRRDVVISLSYDSSGRISQQVVGAAWDADILDGQADDTPVTDRNQQSIATYSYLAGTTKPTAVIRDGATTNYTYDYRQRVTEVQTYPYAGKLLAKKKTYVNNNLFCEEDPYGRRKYYGYRASDGQLIRYVTGAYPSFTLADQAAVFALTRDTSLNPQYTIRD